MVVISSISVGVLQEEKRTLERELARTRVSANRVATVVANEWKDGNDKVMPVKQWLEERKFMQVSKAVGCFLTELERLYIMLNFRIVII
jgi:negative regulator of replication initiation